jgi:leucyl aminopeptidase (aminopeptidase T)
MNATRILSVAAVALLGAAALVDAQAPVRHPNLADTLVNSCGNVRQNDKVWIQGGTHDQRLLEDLAIEVRKLGGHPLISFGSDRLTRNFYTEVPEKFDSLEPAFALELAKTIDAVITVEYGQSLDLLADIPEERVIKHEKAHQPVQKTMLERGVLQVHLGNGLYPTIARSKQFGISENALSEIFWSGVGVDYAQLQTTATKVKSLFASGKEVRITAPNGTDIKIGITERPVFVSDGVISEEDRYAGGPACQVWLPAGEVYVVPVPGTAEGKFVAENFFWEGQWIDGLTLSFSKGKLTGLSAKNDISALQKAYDAAPAGREIFAALDLGINPNVQAPANSRFSSWMGAGAISIGIGNNVWAGGDNAVPFELYAHLVNGSLTIDNQKVVEKGKLIAAR